MGLIAASFGSDGADLSGTVAVEDFTDAIDAGGVDLATGVTGWAAAKVTAAPTTFGCPGAGVTEVTTAEGATGDEIGLAGATSVFGTSTGFVFGDKAFSAGTTTGLVPAGLVSSTNFSIAVGNTIGVPNGWGDGFAAGVVELGGGGERFLGLLDGDGLLSIFPGTATGTGAAAGGVVGVTTASGVGEGGMGDCAGGLLESTRVASFRPGRTSVEGRFFAITRPRLIALFW